MVGFPRRAALGDGALDLVVVPRRLAEPRRAVVARRIRDAVVPVRVEAAEALAFVAVRNGRVRSRRACLLRPVPVFAPRDDERGKNRRAGQEHAHDPRTGHVPSALLVSPKLVLDHRRTSAAALGVPSTQLLLPPFLTPSGAQIKVRLRELDRVLRCPGPALRARAPTPSRGCRARTRRPGARRTPTRAARPPTP